MFNVTTYLPIYLSIYLNFTNASSFLLDGEWISWSQWSDCSETCGLGEQSRNIVCIEKSEEGVQICPNVGGQQNETQACNLGVCPQPGKSNSSLFVNCCENCVMLFLLCCNFNNS